MAVLLPATAAALQCIGEANLDDYFVDHFLDGPEPWDERMRIRLMPQLGYLDFVKLMVAARMAITDCQDIQNASKVLGVPCISVANGEFGAAFLDDIAKNWCAGNRSYSRTYSLVHLATQLRAAWRKANDGRAGQRIIEILLNDFGARNPEWSDSGPG